MKRIALFEDSGSDGLSPIALMRPVFELVCGQFSLRERLIRCCEVAEWGAFVRSHLAETYRESQPEAHVNDSIWLSAAVTLLINGRWVPDAAAIRKLASAADNEVGMLNDQIVFLTLDPLEAALLEDVPWDELLEQLAASRTAVDVSGTMIQHPWDLINHNGDQLSTDFQLRQFGHAAAPFGCQVSLGTQNVLGPDVAVIGNKSDLFVDKTARIDPYVVLDARHGPISINAGAVIQPFTRLEGPCHVGRDSQLFRANVREGTTVGPVCRVGGEVEESILHGFVNSYHDGFLGHSYVCPWVNMGALTTNSDLKNDYSNVRIPLSGDMIDTGSTKVGCFIGDHSKTALCSLFNTGSSIGLFGMVLPGGGLLPKHIPSFCRIWNGVLDDRVTLEAALTTARTAMGRRNEEFTPAQERLVRHLFEHTRAERETAVERFAAKLQARRENSVTA